MIDLELNKYHEFLKIKEDETGRSIFDPVRKKYVRVQPEELVRQSWIQYLTMTCGLSLASLGVEKQFMLNNRTRRFDLVYYKKGVPNTLFEFKSFNKSIDNDTAFQAAQYNIELKVPYIIISNGLVHYAFNIDFQENEYRILDELSFLKNKSFQ